MSLQIEGGIQVIYDESIQKPKVPYEVSVDQARATQLFLQNGVPADRVAQARLILMESPHEYLGQVGGTFNFEQFAICLYPDITFKRQRERKPNYSLNETFLHEAKHLINYVHRPDYERRMHRFFDKAQGITLTVGVITLSIVGAIGILANEIPQRNEQGLADFTTKFIFGGSAWMLACSALYNMRPNEISARRFASRYNKKPAWQSIVTISPKPT